MQYSKIKKKIIFLDQIFEASCRKAMIYYSCGTKAMASRIFWIGCIILITIFTLKYRAVSRSNQNKLLHFF